MIFTKEIQDILKENFTAPLHINEVEENCGAMLRSYLEKSTATLKIFSEEKINKKHPSISVCLTDSFALDASVMPLKNPNEFLISLSYGMFADIYACFTGLLSHSKILPYIGNPADTHCGFDMCEYGLLDFTFEHDVIRQHTPLARGFPLYNYPKDEERILYATLLCDIAIQFIVYHEWGHISGGHVDYMNEMYYAGKITETGAAMPVNRNLKHTIGGFPLRRSMEFEADYIAASMIASLPANLYLHKRTIFQAYPPAFLEKYEIRDAIFFSIIALFHLFEEVRLKMDKEPSKIYPSPYFRFCSLLFGIYGHGNKEPDPHWKDFDYRGVKNFAIASQALGFNFRFTNEVYDRAATRKEIIKLDDNLGELRMLLKNYRLHT